jgi:hypothetical protein
MRLFYEHDLKYLSLEDNVYFTLCDIFLNATCADDVLASQDFNRRIAKGERYEDRCNTFTYADVLSDKTVLERLIRFFAYYDPRTPHVLHDLHDLHDSSEEDTNKDNKDEEITIYSKTNVVHKKYITVAKWWRDFTELRFRLRLKLDEIE